MERKRWNGLIVLTLLLSVVTLFVEQMELSGVASLIFTNLIDLTILFILIAEIVSEYRHAPYKKIFFKRNVFSLAFSAAFIVLFVYNKYLVVSGLFFSVEDGSVSILVVRNFFLVLKVFSRYRRIATILEGLHLHPARTIMMSFFVVILAGTWLLMMPFTARVGEGLPFLNALFTATSAVCVTGLIVVDTAVYFSFWGQLVVMLLIQIGGLGIMVLSYFTLFVMGRKVSVEKKKLVSYMLSEQDMNNLSRSLKTIIGITFAVEALGALLLFAGFSGLFPDTGERVFNSVFHAVSAFCNAGFALFSDSLESFSANPVVLLAISGLIIAGGLSFAVITNLYQVIASAIRRFFRKQSEAIMKLTLSSRVVLFISGWLLVCGTLLFYALEHSGSLKNLPLGRQYLAAFFQSVTLRTAGCNSVPFGNLSTAVLMIMVIFMFIGGASGSTAGGIKVNTLAVLGASVRSLWRNDSQVRIAEKAIPEESVNRSFLIFLFGVVAVVIGTVVLAVTEQAQLDDIIFETVSAFGTVGLSTGLTGTLSTPGKIVITALMFLGRLGPLTVLSAASRVSPKLQITYPQANIAIG